MKQNLLLIGLLMTGALSHAQVGIGTTTPSTSSALDITSTTAGLLIPRMTSVQKEAIATPATGLQVFDTTTNSLWFFNGTAWTNGAPIAPSNIYNTDGVLAGNRYVNMDSKALTFYSGTSNISLNNTPTRSDLRATAADNSYADLYVDTHGPAFLMAGGTATSLNIGSSTGDNTPLRFVTNGLNRGVVLGNGTMGIGTDAPDVSSLLEVSSTTKGFLLPRMTSLERAAITTPANGLQVFDITTNSPWYFNGIVWINGAPIASSNIYNTNGTLTGARTVTMGGNTLGFVGGNVGIGTIAPLGNLHVIGAVNTRSIVTLSSGATTAVNTSLHLGNLDFTGFDGTSTPSGTSAPAKVGAVPTETWNNAAHGTALYFTTTGNGTAPTIPVERMRIDQNGNVGIGSITPTAKLQVEATSGDNVQITNGVSKWGLTSTVGTGSSSSNSFGVIDRVSGIRRMIFNDNGNVYLGGPIGSDTGLSSVLSIVGSNVGLGNLSPATKLDVAGATTTSSSIQAINTAVGAGNVNYIRAVAGGIDTRIQNNGAGYGMVGTFTNNDLVLAANGGTHVYIKPTGRVGIGTGAPAYQLDVLGDINASGSVRASGLALTSDVRLKKNIVPVKNALSSVMQLNAVSYDKKESISSNKYNTSEIGFIAQDLRKVFPTLVTEGNDADKTLAVNYTALIPVLTKAIQEQQAEISQLKSYNEASEAAFAKLAAEVKELKEALIKK